MKNAFSSRCLVGLLLAAWAFPLSAEGPAGFEIAPDTVQRSKAATVLVDLGQSGSGSAFLIHRSGLFVTNRHVIASVPSGEPVKLVVHSGEEDELAIEARVVLVSEDEDLALLKTEAKLAIDPLPLRSAKEAKLGELSQIAVLGYPFGRRLAAEGQDYPSISINTGRVSRLEKTGGRLAQIQYDAATNPGNSGGPMITADGSVVGVVVSGFRGAAVNFAIPAERVMALIEKPVIALHPTEIPFIERHARQDFEIELLPTAPLPANPEVALHLIGPDGKRHSLPATLRDGRFRVTAPLLEEPDDASPLRLRIEAKLPDATVIANVDDQPVEVGGESIPLSGVLLVGEQNGKLKTLLSRPGEQQRFETVDGVPTGLPVLHSEHHDLKLGLDSIKELRVSSYGCETLTMPFEIEVKGDDGPSLVREGTIRLINPPPNLSGSSRPMKKDFFSGMFGRNERDSGLDLLSLTDPEKDARAGDWEVVGERADLETADDSPTWLEAPARATGDYVFKLEVVPSADSTGEVRIQLPVGDSVALLRFEGGDKGRATVANDNGRGEDDALEIPSFEKGIPFGVTVMVSDGELVAAMMITRKSGNSTSRMPLPERLKWSGDPAGLVSPDDCPLPAGRMGVGISGQRMRITTLEIEASPGQLLVSRELPPVIRHHPSGTPVHWNLDEMRLRGMVQGREEDSGRNGFPGFSGDMSWAGNALGDPDIGAETCIEGKGSMRVEGEKAGFQIPSHPRLWKPSFGISFWFMADAVDDTQRRRHLFDEGGKRTGMSVYLLGDTLRAGAWDDSPEKPVDRWATWLAAPGIKAGEWHHVALSLNADADDPDTAFRLFLNGKLVDEGFGRKLNEQREPGAVGTILGSSRPCPEDPDGTQHTQFAGWIDSFRIHRGPLDVDQLKLVVGGRFAEKDARFPELPEKEKEDLGIDLNGRWMDMNGGEIEIRHDGRKVEAIALNEKVKRHWTRAEGRLRGRVLRITHFKDGKETARKGGSVSQDKNRIAWGPQNHWKRLPDDPEAE